MDTDLILRHLRSGSRLRKERGVWVFEGDASLSLDEANAIVRDSREERDRQNNGDRV